MSPQLRQSGFSDEDVQVINAEVDKNTNWRVISKWLYGLLAVPILGYFFHFKDQTPADSRVRFAVIENNQQAIKEDISDLRKLIESELAKIKKSAN